MQLDPFLAGMASEAPTSKNRIKTAGTIFQLVETLEELNGATCTELANELGIPVSTMHDHLSTLLELEYLVEEDGVYRNGLKFLQRGIAVRNNIPISTIIQPTLDDLADETGEVAWLSVEEHGKIVYLNNAKGSQAVQTHAEIGARAHMHYLAAGKAILAHFPTDRVREIIDRHDLPEATKRTITSSECLFEELEEIREQGFAFNDGERVLGLRAVAAPIFQNSNILGTLGISGPANRMKGERFREEIPEILMGATNELELKLEYSPLITRH